MASIKKGIKMNEQQDQNSQKKKKNTKIWVLTAVIFLIIAALITLFAVLGGEVCG